MINKVELTLGDLEYIIEILKKTENTHVSITSEEKEFGVVTDIEVFLRHNDITGTFRVNIKDEDD